MKLIDDYVKNKYGGFDYGWFVIWFWMLLIIILVWKVIIDLIIVFIWGISIIFFREMLLINIILIFYFGELWW